MIRKGKYQATKSSQEAKHQCGDFCEVCGDCIVCFGEDKCLDGKEHVPPVKETQL